MSEIKEYKRRHSMDRFSLTVSDVSIVTAGDVNKILGVKLVPLFYRPLNVVYDIVLTVVTGTGGPSTNDVNYTIRTVPGVGAPVNDQLIFDIGSDVAFVTDANIVAADKRKTFVDIVMVHGTDFA